MINQAIQKSSFLFQEATGGDASIKQGDKPRKNTQIQGREDPAQEKEAVQGFPRTIGKSQENCWQGEVWGGGEWGRGRYKSGSTGSLRALELQARLWAPYMVPEAMIRSFCQL